MSPDMVNSVQQPMSYSRLLLENSVPVPLCPIQTSDADALIGNNHGVTRPFSLQQEQQVKQYHKLEEQKEQQQQQEQLKKQLQDWLLSTLPGMMTQMLQGIQQQSKQQTSSSP